MTPAAKLLNTIAQELNTTDKNLCISVGISMLVAQGLTVQQAVDALFGEGGFDKLAGRVYEQLRAA